MKHIFLPVMLFFFCVELPAQSRQHKIDSVSILVTKYFNTKNADSIYALAGEKFKTSLSLAQFQQIAHANLFVLGTMQATFEQHTNGVSKYKAQFATQTLAMYISLDDKDKLFTFLFKEFVDDTRKKAQVLTTNPASSLLDQAVDSVVRPYVSLEATAGLSIGILKEGKMYFYGYGETAKGSGQIPDQHTLFEIGSITKTFTATLLADAVNKGKIKLDDPVNKYLPDSIAPLQFEGVPVTIKMLSNHSSAIPRMPDNFDSMTTDALNPYKNYDDRRMYSFYTTLKLSRKPGTVYEYSNMAVATLGLILERIYKKSFEQLVTELICAPLGMTETRQFLRKNDSARFAKGYNETGGYVGQWDFDAFAAAGSLRSTAADMLLYAKANLGNAPASLNKAIQLTHAVTFQDGANKTALGWHYTKLGATEILGHNGGTGGYRSYLAMDTGKKIAVIILSNSAISTDDIGKELMAKLEKN